MASRRRWSVRRLKLRRTWEFWSYVEADTIIGPILIYPLAMLLFAILATIGWQVRRRFGARALAIFIGVVTVIGAPRDYFEGYRLFGIIKFGPGVLPWIWDVLAWGTLSGIAIAVMERVAGRDDDLTGPPRSTSLDRTRS